MYYLYFIVILLFIHSCYTDYFYPSKSNIFSIPENDKTYFGYSLQLQQGNELDGRIIVGAPKANSTKINSNNGVLFSCPINTKQCEEIPLEQNELQYHIGLGSAVDAEPFENGFVIACAPRWSNNAIQSTIGMCFSLKNNNLHNKLYPLEKQPFVKSSTYYSQYGQVGFSAHFIQNEKSSVILGSPGVYGWTGTLASYDTLNKVTESVITEAKRGDHKTTLYSYFGYSISSGKFNVSNPNQIFYVSGAPRNNDLYGSVNIFELQKNEAFLNRYMFGGTQFGEYFGASLAVGIIDGDNLDDIIIGAPTHSTDSGDDVGCIYVFQTVKNENMLKFTLSSKILGEQRGSKFGFALSYLGDVNSDGYGDIAVGAPYYDESGAIYIYLGSEKGLKTHYKQRILASNIDKTLRGFGNSLSRGLDVDHNTNNDLAVGAYISGQVVLLKSRPIVKIQTNMSLDSGSHLNINTTNIKITYCVNYKADMRLPPNNIKLIFTIMNANRVTFENNDNQWVNVIYIQGENETCGSFQIILNGHTFSDINLHMDYNILNTSLEEKFIPVKEPNSLITLHIPFNKGCSSNICRPNLKLTAVFGNIGSDWIIGSSQNVNLSVLLENFGEPSYSNKLVIEVIPRHLKFLEFPHYCEQLNNKINCIFKNPILDHENRELGFTLDGTKLNLDDPKIVLNATIITDKDTDITDNTKVLEVSLKTDVNFQILPKSQPEEINNLTGIQTLNHQYNIENVGATRVNELKLSILIPYEVKLTEFLYSFDVIGCSRTTIFNESTSTNDINNGLVTDLTTDNTLFVNCTTLKGDHVKCKKIECEIENIFRSFSINITMMINATSIDGLRNEGPIILSTGLEPDFKFISSYSYIWTKLVKKQLTSANITLYIVIGILVSLLLVSILIFVLYKCGFFTRKKVPYEFERAQLLKMDME